MKHAIDTRKAATFLMLLLAALAAPAQAQRARPARTAAPKTPPKTPVNPPANPPANPPVNPPASPPANPAKQASRAPATETAGEVSVTVAQAVQAALAYHPEAVKQQLEVEIADVEITRQRGLFRPVLTATALERREGAYVANAASAVSGVATARTTVMETAITGRTTWGGIYSVGFRGERVSGFSLLSTLLPQYQTRAGARYTQPLLRDGGFTANRGLVDRAEIASESSRALQRQQREQLALEVVASYWDLVVRREEVRIREANLSQAASLRELVERRIKGGQAPKSDVVQADVTVAEREQAVRVAQLAVVEAERALLALTYLNRTGRFGWDDAVVPTQRPGTQPAMVDFDKELALALRHRPELRRIERELALARLNQGIASNGQRMRVDVYAEAGVLGVAGRSTVPAGDPNEPPELLIGGLGKAAGNMAGGEAPFFEVGLQLEIPFGNGTRAGAAQQAKLRVDQVLAEDVRTVVALDVRAAMHALTIARSRVVGAATAEKLAIENVDVQRKRYEGGAATIFDTLRVQDELARTKAEMVLAAAAQEVALIQLVAARGTLLEHFGIGTEREK
jgi:outer membrane protein TolC